MSNKIVVLVRTRDEELRIAKFCAAYERADLILVADGGSVDRTKEIASTFPNVIIRDFTERVQLKNGHWRNNDAAHANFLIQWSKEYKPDWVIYDDCDCRPNKLLKRLYRGMLKNEKNNFVMVTRIYCWRTSEHFPNMAKPGVDHRYWEPSLWAWRGSIDFKMVDVPPAYTFRIGDVDIKDLHTDAHTSDWYPPLCLLHYSWDDPARVERKVKLYRDSGLIPGQLHPLVFAGPIEPLPWWAHE